MVTAPNNTNYGWNILIKTLKTDCIVLIQTYTENMFTLEPQTMAGCIKTKQNKL